MISIEDTMLERKVTLEEEVLEAWQVILLLLGEGGGATRSKIDAMDNAIAYATASGRHG
jgi:hypothetical protein